MRKQGLKGFTKQTRVLYAAAISMAAALSSCGPDIETQETASDPLYKLSWYGEGQPKARWNVDAYTKDAPFQVTLGDNGPPGAPQVANVTCDKDPVEQGADGQWTLPQGCAWLKWTVTLENAGQADASRQRSLVDPKNGWVMIADVYSLFRPVEEPFSTGIHITQMQGFSWCKADKNAPDLCQWNAGGPPDFLIWSDRFDVGVEGPGALPVLSLAMDGDHDKFGLVEIQARGLDYLLDVTGMDERSAVETLIPEDYDIFSDPLIIFRLPKCLDREVVAVAGETNVILSAPCQQNEGAKLRVLTTLLHESFHYIVQEALMPLWAGESLASYYGVVAMDHVVESEAATALFEQYINMGQRPGYGLIVAQHKVESGEDPAAYSQLYFQGAAFWADVDGFAQDHGPGLDHYLPLLLKGDWGEDHMLPKDFDAKLRAFDEMAWQALLDKHF